MPEGNLTVINSKNLSLFALTFGALGTVPALVDLHCAQAHSGHHHTLSEDMDRDRPGAIRNESLFQLESKWTNQDGKRIKLGDLQGKPTVLAMMYTACQGACPILTSDMQRIEKSVPSHVRQTIQFVIVSFDSERDTPQRLAKFAEKHQMNKKNWTLLTGSQNDVRELAAVLGIKYKKDDSGNFSHSNVITILDPKGLIQHQQVGLQQDPGPSIKVISEKLGS
jgi:protein SCO1/2